MSQEEIIIEKEVVNKKWRVKLYELSQGRQWSDNGTGYVYLEETPQASLIMEVSDNSLNNDHSSSSVDGCGNGKIIKFAIDDSVTFNLQNKTILTWRRSSDGNGSGNEKGSGDKEEEDDTAISFQEKEGVNEIWKFICDYTGRKDSSDDTLLLTGSDDNIVDALFDVSRNNLPFIAREIREDLIDEANASDNDCNDNSTSSNANANSNANGHQIKDLLVYIKSNDCDFIKKLGKVFIEEERELERKDGSILSATTISRHDSLISNKTIRESRSIQKNLSFIYSIFKNIIILADEELLECLMSNSLYMITFGALEYDFESQQSITSFKHRDYLKNEVRFNNYLGITDETLLNKIHLNYRLTYLRYTALPEISKDSFNQRIKTMIKKNNDKIVSYFITHKEVLTTLINKLTISTDTNKLLSQDQNQSQMNEVIRNGLSFIIELMNCSKETVRYKLPLNNALCDLNLIDKLVTILNYNSNQLPKQINDTTSVLAVKIIMQMAFCFPLLIKDIIIGNKTPILSLITDCVLNQSDLSLKDDLAHLISTLFDNCSQYDPIENKLKACLLYLVNFLPNQAIDPESKVIILRIINQSLSSSNNITQLSTWVNENDIEEKVLTIKSMTKSKAIILHLIQFLNVLIANDYDIVLSKYTLDWIIETFNTMIGKGNAIASAILNLFNSIKMKKNSLISYLFSIRSMFFYENHKYFKGLIDEYENDNSSDNENSENDLNINVDIDGKDKDNEKDNDDEDDESLFDLNDNDCNRNNMPNIILSDDDDLIFKDDDYDIEFSKNCYYAEEEKEKEYTFLGKKTHSPNADYDDIINTSSHFAK